MTIAELRAARQTAWAKAEALDAKGKESPLSADDEAAFEAALAEYAQHEAAIKAQEDAAADAAAATAKRASTLASMRAAQAEPGRRRTAPDANQPTVTNVRDRVLDDPKRGFATFAHFALEVWECGGNISAIRSNAKLMAAAGTPTMQQGVTADGGVLVPPAFSTQVWDGARQQSNSMLGYCQQIPLEAGVESITIPAINETSRADGSRWGGIQGYWKAELTTMTATKPAARELKFEPQELYVFGYISDKLLRNSPAAASAMLTTAAADEINFKVGKAIFAGDGAGKPLGFLTHAATISIAKETGQAAATIVAANINKMYARCHINWRQGAVWFTNQDVEPALETLSLAVGTGGVPLYTPPGGISEAPYARLKGLPIIPLEYCKTLGTVGDIVLANLGAYGVVTRSMVDQQQSMHLKFDAAQTAFRFIFEVGGQPLLASAITPHEGTNTTSPIVTLATRS